MAHTGYVDWTRLDRSPGWISTGEGSTFVYAFWMADYGFRLSDMGLALLRPDGAHPDWFCAGPRVDRVLTAELHPRDVVSPNVKDVYDEHFSAHPMLASICLGSASTTYCTPELDLYWWAHPGDLTKRGDKLVKDMTALYSRPPVILTFLDFAPISQGDPGAAGSPATAASPQGH